MAATTSDKSAELIKEWAPDTAKLEKFNAVEKEKTRLYDHCGGENSKLSKEAEPVEHEKKQLDELEDCDQKESARLVAELDKQIQKMKTLGDERDQLESQSRTLTERVESDQTTMDDEELKIKECEKEMIASNERQERLMEESREIQQRMDDLKQKENENINEQNHLQLSMSGLQDLIAQIQQELEEQQQHLAEEQAQLKETEQTIEKLKEQLKQLEAQMKRIQMESEHLKEQQLDLTQKQDDLKKQQEQLQTIIQQLQKILKQKEDGLVQMQLEIEKYKEKIEKLKQQLEKIRYLLLYTGKTFHFCIVILVKKYKN